MENQTDFKIQCSAPSKALITGAYLITEPYYQGIVISCSARFNTSMQVVYSGTDTVECTKIRCISRQMDENDWVFKLKVNEDSMKVTTEDDKDDSVADGPAGYAQYILITFYTLLKSLKTISSEKRNEFMQKINEKLISEIVFEFVGDDAFYGHRMENGKLAKTGMGSSATFIASFIGCLYVLIDNNTELSEEQLKEVHILAQIANSVCQNKIGSGFDIASAVYSSLVFKRFEPSSLYSLSQDLRSLNFENVAMTYDVFYTDFDFIPKRFILPKHFHLCMISLSEGSDTKVMVKNLLKWSKDRRRVFTDSDEDEGLEQDSIFTCKEWDNVNQRGKAILDLFSKLNELEENEDYTQAIQDIIDNNKTDSDVEKVINGLREQNNQYRLDLSCITMLSGVQVEPMRATEILNEILKQISQSVMIGVPGAGGDDAAYMLYLSTDSDQTEMRSTIKQELDKVNDNLNSQCCLLPIQTNTKGPIRFEVS